MRQRRAPHHLMVASRGLGPSDAKDESALPRQLEAGPQLASRNRVGQVGDARRRVVYILLLLAARQASRNVVQQFDRAAVVKAGTRRGREAHRERTRGLLRLHDRRVRNGKVAGGEAIVLGLLIAARRIRRTAVAAAPKEKAHYYGG